MTLIFLTALLTGLGIFDNIAKFGGAGTLVSVDSSAKLVGTAEPGAEIECFDYAGGKLLCLTQDKLLCYDDSLKLELEAEQTGAQTALLRANDAVLISGTEVKTTNIK